MHDRLQDRFVVEDRGIISVKGKGPTQTYFLVEERECASLSESVID